MTTEEIKRECIKHIGKTYECNDNKWYKHGQAVSITITGVKQDWYGITVLNSMTFTDGYSTPADSYSCDGLGFLMWLKQTRQG